MKHLFCTWISGGSSSSSSADVSTTARHPLSAKLCAAASAPALTKSSGGSSAMSSAASLMSRCSCGSDCAVTGTPRSSARTPARKEACSSTGSIGGQEGVKRGACQVILSALGHCYYTFPFSKSRGLCTVG
eukprot:5650231-Pyramimonas_sp.AAC.1